LLIFLKRLYQLLLDKKRVAVLFTGGKDSTYAIETLRNDGYEVACLVTMISENIASYMLHTPNIRIAELSAAALEIPIEFGFTEGKKEEELSDIRDSLVEARSKFSFDSLGSGGLSSEYQRSRLGRIAEDLQLSSLNPLWGIDQRNYLKMLVEKSYDFVLTSVAAAGLDNSWLGKTLDRQAVNELLRLSEKYRFNPAFEGGEAETLVLDCPLFMTKRIEIVEAEKNWNGLSGELVIKNATLVDKNSELRIHPDPAD
jgi:diphthine-ammonia ligase